MTTTAQNDELVAALKNALYVLNQKNPNPTDLKYVKQLLREALKNASSTSRPYHIIEGAA